MNTRRAMITTPLLASVMVVIGASSGFAAPPAPPDPVIEALADGGSAERLAVRLRADDGTGVSNPLSTDQVRFGEPMPYRAFKARAASGPLAEADFARIQSWLAVYYENDEAVSVGQFGEDGRLMALDGWTPESVKNLAGLGAGTTVVGDSPSFQTFGVSANGKIITPVDEGASDLLRGKSADAKTFRTLKQEEIAARDKAEDDAVAANPGKSDLVGGAGVTQRQSPLELLHGPGGWVLIAAGTLLVAVGGTPIIRR